jgi:ABC-type transport system involved in multi-copper enzyme maturation permease subunit
MIWFAWRQFRTQALAVTAILLVFFTALALTWTQVTGLARDTGFTGCQVNACGDAAEAFLGALSNETAGWLYDAGIGVLLVLPILLGMFWGAPLVARELETGTYRMIFSQSVSRRRWLLVKLAVGGVAAALSAGLASLVLSRWAAPIDLAGSRISPVTFATRGIVPIAYAALALVIGVTVGMVLRRSLAAMAATLLVVVAVQVAMPLALLPLLAQPVTSVTALDPHKGFVYRMGPLPNEMHLDAAAHIPEAWILSRTTVTSTGAEFRGPADPTRCGPLDPMSHGPSDECRAWLATQNLSLKLTYVPGSSFWALQWREFGVLIALALGLSWFSLWWIRRRLA